jgi:hypothetical protein
MHPVNVSVKNWTPQPLPANASLAPCPASGLASAIRANRRVSRAAVIRRSVGIVADFRFFVQDRVQQGGADLHFAAVGRRCRAALVLQARQMGLDI